MATLKMPKTRVEEETPETLEQEFNELARQCRTETGMASFIRQKAMHPAYPKIIGMGKDALPLLFRDLSVCGGGWLWAIESIVRLKVTPAQGAASFKDAGAAWLKW